MTRRYWMIGLRAAVAALLVGLVLKYVPIGDIGAALDSMQLRWLWPAALVVFAWRTIAAMRLSVFAAAQGLHSGTPRLLGISLISSFFAAATPGFALNGVVRWYLLSEAGRFKTAALSALFGDRLFDLVANLGLGLIGLALSPLATPRWLRVSAAVLFLLLVTAWLLLMSPVASRLLERLASRLPGRFTGPGQRLAQAQQRFRALTLAQRARVGVLALASNMLNAWGTYCLFLALALPLGYADALWLRCAVFVAGVLPITLLGLGVREAMLTTLLVPAGIAPASAVALSVLLLARDLLAAAAGGVLLAFWKQRLPEGLVRGGVSR